MERLLFAHPVAMGLLVQLVCVTLLFGLPQALNNALGTKLPFRAATHVTLGKLCVLGLMAGMVFGAGMSWTYFPALGVGFTGGHFLGALFVVLPQCLVALLTGRVLVARRVAGAPTGRMLPVVHGCNNALLLFTGVVQALTGLGVLQNVVLPRLG